MFCDDLEGWDGTEAQEGGNIYIVIIYSHCCMAESNTTL